MQDSASRIATAALVLLTAVFLVTAGRLVSAQPDLVEGCGRTGPRIDGRQTGIGQTDIKLTVALPSEGTFFSLPASPDEGPLPSLFICHVESGSSIVIDGTTGQEVTRTVGDPAGAAVLDQILAGSRIEPTLPAQTTPGGGGVSPPQTGDGGLKGASR